MVDARTVGYALPAVGILAGLASLVVVAGEPPAAVVPGAVGAGSVVVYAVAERRYGLNPGWPKLALGGGVAGLGVAAVALGGGGPLVVTGLLVVGCWLVLDGVYDHRTDPDRPPFWADLFAFVAVDRVTETLADEPRSEAALVEALDLPADRVRAALAVLERSGRVERRDGVYHAVGSGRSTWDSVRTAPRRFWRRLARPFGLFTG